MILPLVPVVILFKLFIKIIAFPVTQKDMRKTVNSLDKIIPSILCE